MKRLDIGDYVEFNNRLYIIQQDSDGKPIFNRFYTDSCEMFEDRISNLEKTVGKMAVRLEIKM